MRLRLVMLVMATTSLVLVAFLIPLARLVQTAAIDRAVSAAVVDVQSFGPTVVSAEPAALSQLLADTNQRSLHKITVFLPDGTVVGVPARRSAAVDLAAKGRSITADAPGGREVLDAVAGLPDGTAVIRTFVSDEELSRGVVHSWIVLGLLGLGLLGVSVLVADLLARALTRPLSAVAQVSHRLARGNLDARAVPEGPPEVLQVGAGLNLLADRIGELLARERETVADLSHRLRTPLTALRIDAESLADPGDRARITADVEAVQRTVDDVIRAARRPTPDGVALVCDAAELVADRVAFWSALAEEENRAFTVDVVPGPLPLRVGWEDLAACVDALLGNVFAHTPEGTALGVQLRPRAEGGARLVVADDGPGLPDSLVLRRGHSGGNSTGLGLDIVMRTARDTGGGVRLGRTASGGALVALDLGPPVRPEISRRVPAHARR